MRSREYKQDQSSILLATGEAFMVLGDRAAAMQRFSRALDAPQGDVIETRLALARLFANEGRGEEARQQVAWGFAEARVSDNIPIKPEHLVEAADIFLSTHEFELSTMYLQRALAAGADEDVVALRMTEAYLGEGKTSSAEAQLASVAPGWLRPELRLPHGKSQQTPRAPGKRTRHDCFCSGQ
jgi:Tfp pilus assembly protein PilF